MKIRQRLIPIFLTLVLWTGFPAFPAAASSVMEYEGLEVSMKMDKEQYNDDEPITATITVKNTTFETITIVTLEQLIPEGYQLSENQKASVENIELPPSRTLVLEVTFEKIPAPEEAAAEEDFFSKLFYGKTGNIPNFLLAVLLVLAFAVYMLLT